MEEKAAVPRTGPEVAAALIFDAPLLRRLRRCGVNRFGVAQADLDDVLQETCMELLGATELILRPRGYVMRIFYTRCCRWRERHDEEKSGRLVDARAAGLYSDQERALRPEELLGLSRAMTKLPPAARRLVAAHYLDGKSLKETAEESGYSSKQMWKRIDRWLRLMRRDMEGR